MNKKDKKFYTIFIVLIILLFIATAFTNFAIYKIRGDSFFALGKTIIRLETEIETLTTSVNGLIEMIETHGIFIR